MNQLGASSPTPLLSSKRTWLCPWAPSKDEASRQGTGRALEYHAPVFRIPGIGASVPCKRVALRIDHVVKLSSLQLVPHTRTRDV